MTAAAASRAEATGLWPWSLFAGMLAMAGLPIYIHAPKLYVDEYGVSLAAMGGVLFALRLLDFAQDPFFGWLTERLGKLRGPAMALAAAAMAVAMLGLFAAAPPVAPILWFALTLTLLFSAFSFLTVGFYAIGVAKAETLGVGAKGHVRLAAWRETGALIGICLAALAPAALALLTDRPFAAFALGFAALALLAAAALRAEWSAAPSRAPTGLKIILADPLLRRLLLIALLNATPVAVTSTLFLFFVESRLAAPGWEGPLLLAFFLSAAAAAPLWGRAAERLGAKTALLSGMALSIAAFGGAATLGAGDHFAFALICLASGAALGADMTLLPALFARRLARIAPSAGQGFGLWSFVSKFTLAIAAAALLPLLQASGFSAGAENPSQALLALTLLYALLPCALKFAALALLWATPLNEG